MSDWNIPESLDDLFTNVPESYSIIDRDEVGDNIFAMNLFVESIPGLEQCIVEEYGTQIIAEKDGKTICIDSGGLGDFHMHGYDVNLVVKDNQGQPQEVLNDE